MKNSHVYYRHILAGKHRNVASNKSLGRSLAFVAGAINAGGFMAVGQYTSHMTGIISLAADNIALNQWAVTAMLLFYILCFICGAMATTILVIWGRNKHLHSQYALPLALEALLLVVFGLGSFYYSASSIIALLCFLMGLQNAVITKITDTTIRTTHITGMSTDIGIEMGRIIYSLYGKKLPAVKYNKERLIMHLSIVSSFLLGGVIGGYGFKYVGFGFVLPIAAYLLYLVLFPIWQDFSLVRYIHNRKRRLV